MRTGGTLNQLTAKLKNIINNKINLIDKNSELDITVEDLDAFALNEEGLSVALSSATNAKELHVLNKTAIEDLCSETYDKNSAVIARIRLNNIQTSVPPSNAKRVGDFDYIYDVTLGASLYYMNRKIHFGPTADKLVAFLLEHEGEWKNKYSIAKGSGGRTNGVSQMVYDINNKVARLTFGEVKTLIECDGNGKYRIDT